MSKGTSRHDDDGPEAPAGAASATTKALAKTKTGRVGAAAAAGVRVGSQRTRRCCSPTSSTGIHNSRPLPHLTLYTTKQQQPWPPST